MNLQSNDKRIVVAEKLYFFNEVNRSSSYFICGHRVIEILITIKF